MAEAIWYGIGIGSIFLIVIFVFFINQLRQSRKKSKLDSGAHISPSSFDSESKTKMMSRLDKRESKIRRERILEGGTLPSLSELVIYYPTKKEKIDDVEVDVRGKTAIRSIVWINDQASFVDVDGSFIGSIKLFKGRNSINIVAIGPYGRHLGTTIPVTCSASGAISPSAIDGRYILPEHSLDIREEEVPLSSLQDTKSKAKSSKKAKERAGSDSIMIDSTITTKSADPIVVSESEIDPSVLAALKGDPLSQDDLVADPGIPFDALEPEPVLETEISEDEIPPIPDITEPEAEQQLPEIPKDVVKEDEIDADAAIVKDDEDELEESVKLLEEVVDTEDEMSSTDDFEPDKMMPKQPDEEEPFEDQLQEFEPLKHDDSGLVKLEVEMKKQELDDERKTVILQFNGFQRKDDGEIVQYIKVEKRLECVLEKWYTTIGIANISKDNLKHVEIQEYVSDTVEFTGKLAENIEEPIVDKVPEGVKITWMINNVKSDGKFFLTYNEKVNPIDLIDEAQIKPTITIRK